MADTWDNFDTYYDFSLNQIANRCKEILEDCIQEEVYDKYTPKSYKRTYQLLNNVEVDIKNGYIYVYVNTGNIHYDSNNKEGNDVTSYVPYWINYGHNTPYSGIFMYDNYPSRQYIQEAKRRIQDEFGYEIQIMGDATD